MSHWYAMREGAKRGVVTGQVTMAAVPARMREGAERGVVIGRCRPRCVANSMRESAECGVITEARTACARAQNVGWLQGSHCAAGRIGACERAQNVG